MARLILLTGALALGACLVIPSAARAQSRSADETIDVALGALEEPLRPWRPGAVTVVPGAPIWPPYKQEPPAAQRDFRVLSSPKGVPPPNSGSAGGAGSGGTGGPGATSPIGTGPPNTTTPPVVGPIPPLPIPSPFPPPGGGGPVLPLRPPRASRVP